MAEHDLPEPEAAREWLGTMMLIRRFEERAGEMYAKAKIGGFLHLAIGEEATIVGSARAMRDEDYLISTYRSHGHAIVRGSSPDNVMAEQFGDGAANQGTFGEALNLAALWKLPVVFMVTNNQFGMGTALERHSAVTDLHKRGDGFGVPGMRCDGMDVLDTYAVASEALKKAREDRQPVLVEAITYRFRGHSMADPEEYRTKEQVEEWRKRDPIASFGKRLVDEEVLTEDDLEELDQQAVATIDEAVRFADQSPHPEPESLYDNVYALGGQVRGWYSLDARAAGVHRGEDEREISQDGARREQFEAVVESQSGDIGDAGSGPSDSAKDSGKKDEAPDEAEDTEKAEA
jgi:pyruvate dehydrogenase E1 component alpha subunit